jgi:hypothetical protein
MKFLCTCHMAYGVSLLQLIVGLMQFVVPVYKDVGQVLAHA